jgi:PIN domain nuclease of toxin-antitoxin system
MKYLLDTHTALWYLGDSPTLPTRTVEIIDNRENNISICSVSIWETAIKANFGKLKTNLTFEEFLDKINNGDFEILHIREEYLRRLFALPYIHKDPFDRLLIATAMVENMTIITADANIHKYDVEWVW